MWSALRPLSLLVTLLVLSCMAHAAPATERRGADVVDVESTRKIREYTTDPAFLTEWVDYLPASRTVPSPTAFLGYVIGTPDRLTQPDKIHEYFRALDRASSRVQVFSMGRTDTGREMIVAAIADAALLGRLDAIKRANRELADPRKTSEARARELAASTPPIYYITAGLHSPEAGPPEMVMELAYRLAVSEEPHIREIRQNVITLITPVLEVDGRARMVDWYRRYLTKLDNLDDTPPLMGPYWGNYTAHDNNRDGLQLSQRLTRNYVATFHEFLPVISLDLHESVPLLYVSLGTGPYNETIDPITVTEWQWIASYEVSEATKHGLRGVWTWGFYDGWYPGYLLWVTNTHNAIGRFYETFGNHHPGTFHRDLRGDTYARERADSRQWYRAWPPDKEFKWSMRNNTNYMQTAVLASLQLVARNGDTLLYNFWKKSKNAVDKGKNEPPHGFVIPMQQRDASSLHHLLSLLSGHRIEVHRARTNARVGDVDIAEGDFLVRMDQPYCNLAKTLLMKTFFPKTAQHSPYDDVAWSLDYMLGVEVRAVRDKAVLDVAMERLTSVPALPGRAAATPRWIVEHKAQRTLVSLRWALGDTARVRALQREWQGHPAGSLIIEGVSQARMDELTRTLHLEAGALAAEPDVGTVDVDLPRVALFHTWLYTQDSGWARYTLEELGVPYTLINKDQVRAGKLRDRFDVIIVPSQGWLSFKEIIHDIDSKWGPMPYTRTEEYPSHGDIDSSPDITGGMGFEGLAHLEAFVRQGGVLVTLGSGGLVAAESGIAREVEARTPGGTPGSHVTTKVLRPEHPLAWGYPAVTHVFRGNLPVYDVSEHWRGLTVMQFGTKTWLEAEREADKKADIPVADEPRASADKGQGKDGDKGKDADKDADRQGKELALSGLVKDPDAIERKPALLDVPVGKGRVVFFSWNPLHRYQNHHDFGFVMNALLFYNDFPAGMPSKQEMRAR